MKSLLARLLGAHHGRSLALVLLALAALLLWRQEAPLFGLRHLLFDHYQRLHPRDRSVVPALVVDIDEASLVAQGQWPWPRDRVADLVARILAGRPLALGIDILFVEPDRLSPPELARRLPQLPGETLAGLPDPDRRLAQALAAGPTVLAVSGVAAALPTARPGGRSVSLVSRGGGGSEGLPAYGAALGSLPALEEAAAGVGLINTPPDRAGGDADLGVLRRLPLAGRIGDALVPALGLEMVRVALGAAALEAQSGLRGLETVGVGDYRLPTRADGQLLLHFGRLAPDRRVSAASVLDGSFAPAGFAGRFVILGLTGVGLVDQVLTPLGEKIPGIDVHAQVIESLLAGDALRRPGWMPALEVGVLLAAGLLLIVALPALRPAYAAGSGAAVAAGLVGAGFAAFVAGGWLFDAATVIALLNPLFILLLGNTLVDADRQRRAAENALQASREAAARDAGELDAARRIQMGLLPDPQALFADESRFRLAARLEPARAVGGDYYECFALDDRRVCFGVGDVSGKGVPASLFMTVAKTLAAALVRRVDDLGEALRQIEVELCRNNPEVLFVTTFIAVLDADSGRLACVCAGHDAPVVRRGPTLLRLEAGDAAGPPVGTLGNYPFVAFSRQLEPGDLVCLFTDGVTEATDGRAYYGGDRLLALLAAAPADGPPEALATAIRDDVRSFEAGHPPADDLTVLVLRWDGPAASRPAAAAA